jgi:hypothetical protein
MADLSTQPPQHDEARAAAVNRSLLVSAAVHWACLGVVVLVLRAVRDPAVGFIGWTGLALAVAMLAAVGLRTFCSLPAFALISSLLTFASSGWFVFAGGYLFLMLLAWATTADRRVDQSKLTALLAFPVLFVGWPVIKSQGNRAIAAFDHWHSLAWPAGRDGRSQDVRASVAVALLSLLFIVPGFGMAVGGGLWLLGGGFIACGVLVPFALRKMADSARRAADRNKRRRS